MIPYDLTARDVEYYWHDAILLYEKDGVFLPVQIQMTGESRDPIGLRRFDNKQPVANLSVDMFIKSCLVHFPPVGYVDVDGVPVYLSPRAGQGRVKGVDMNNLQGYSPVNIRDAANEELVRMTMATRKRAEEGGKIVSKSEVTRRNMLTHLIAYGTNTTSGGGFYIPRLDRTYEHRMIYQAVNKQYLTIPLALDYLRRRHVLGVAIASDYCMIKSAGQNLPVLYHRATPIGLVMDERTVRLSRELSSAARIVLRTLVPFKNVI